MRVSPVQDADYRFLRMYSIDLQTASHALGLLDRCDDADVRMCIIRDIVVTYCRPFSGNQTGNPGEKRNHLHKMLPDIVPSDWQELHDQLRVWRDKLFAHTDLDIHDPKPVMWQTPAGASFPMTIRGHYYDDMNALVPDIRKLVEAVESGVNAAIRARNATLARGAV